MASSFLWTVEMTERLRALVLAGTTATEAAYALNMTRNAVMGKFNRMRGKLVGAERNAFRLAGKGNGRPSTLTPEQRERCLSIKRQAEQRRRDHMKLTAALRLPNQPIVLEELPDTAPIGIMELTSFTCRWPVGAHRPQLYCGAACNFSSPYCQTHRRLGGRLYERPRSDGGFYVQNP